MTGENKPTESAEALKKNKGALTKKQSITIVSVLVILLVVLAVINSVDFDAIINKLKDRNDEIPQYNYFFYDPDYETDIFKDEEYLALDRSISYTEGALTYLDADLDKYDGAPVIKKYLNSMLSGDAVEYAELFTNEYKADKKNVIPDRFPPQRLYLISVERIGEPHKFTADELDGKYKDITRYIFTVSYMIQYNTGTVRNDIDSESIRPLIVEVFEYPTGELLINSMAISEIKN